MKHYTIFLLIGLIVFCGSLAFTQWSADPNVNTPICTADGSQWNLEICSDGAGGAIIVWVDSRGNDGVWPDTSDLYAQRIDASGVIQWTTNGIAISTAANNQSTPVITSDGTGGAIIVWNDYRSNDGVWPDTADIYAQRIDASGALQWTTNGVEISTESDEQSYQKIISDGTGGAIITWHDHRSGTNYDVYAQRINASGVVQWTADGVAIATASGDQQSPILASDGSGGAIITWEDYRNGAFDIYAQRISTAGAVQWTPDGVAISTQLGDEWDPSIVSDGSSGAIISWEDYRNNDHVYPDTSDIYAQRVNATGVLQWDTNGVAITNAADNQFVPEMVSDGAGGAIITWYSGGTPDLVTSFAKGGVSGQDIYAQRVNSAGAVQWATDGIPISMASGNQWSPDITSDGAGGAVIVWVDSRGTNSDIYAQRVNAAGTVQWPTDGAPVSTALGNQKNLAMTSDGAGGAIITWDDFGTGITDSYASRVFADGVLPIQLALFNAAIVHDNSILLEWTTLSEVNNYGFYVERRQENEANFTELPNSFVAGAGTTLEEQHYSWTDENVQAGTYYYRLRQVDLKGDPSYSREIRVNAVMGVNTESAPLVFQLKQNYPNPFNPTTEIKFSVERQERATVKIFNMLGQEIVQLFDGMAEPGRYYRFNFDGSRLGSGMYIYRIVTDSRSDVKKMILMK